MSVAGIPFEFILFALTLAGVALLHGRTLQVAATGMVVIVLYKLFVTGFKTGPGLGGLLGHLAHEWVILANLFCLLVGFALLSKHFEESHVPDALPQYLPDDWKGGFALLAIVFFMSAFLDNIAAALIGGAIANTVFRQKVHIGFIAAIVAASNAGGSGSVVGDTTTTMMWLAGVSPLAVLPAFIAALTALFVFGIPAAKQQHRFQPILKDAQRDNHVDWARVGIVLFILVAAICVNVYVNSNLGELGEKFPFLGVAVWMAILVSAPIRKPDWSLVAGAAKGAVFLLCLVMAASLMPVDKLPPASMATALTLGFVSSVFDNIPLTALAIAQGGFDWGVLAYAVGFGGSMLWFGSSAGVAISSMFPQAKSAAAWLKAGWHIVLAYVVGFAVMAVLWGWHPTPRRADAAAAVPVSSPKTAPPGTTELPRPAQLPTPANK